MRGIMSRSLDLTNEGLINNHTDRGRQKDILRQATEDDKTHFQMGEHVIALWIEGNERKWHLGVVEGMVTENPEISYMVRLYVNKF